MESLGILRLRMRLIRWLLSRKYDGNSFTSGCIKWSTNCEILSEGQLLADTMGRPGGGIVFLWIFGSK